jgi:hypothetical protein
MNHDLLLVESQCQQLKDCCAPTYYVIPQNPRMTTSNVSLLELCYNTLIWTYHISQNTIQLGGKSSMMLYTFLVYQAVWWIEPNG